MFVCEGVCTCAQRGQRHWIPLGLELPACEPHGVAGNQAWLLRQRCALNHCWAVPPAPHCSHGLGASDPLDRASVSGCIPHPLQLFILR